MTQSSVTSSRRAPSSSGRCKSIHAGNIFGMPGSGKRIERTIAYFFTFRGGLIEKERRLYDFTSMLMQLGVLKAKPN